MSRVAAFFDIDGTIYREGLITELFKKIITHELVNPEKWHEDVLPSFVKWDHRQGDYEEYLDKMVNIYASSIIGISEEHIKHIAKKVIEQKGDRVYTFTRDEILRHQKAGHVVIAISGSPLELVKCMAEKYKFDDYKGTTYCVDEKQCYTGEILPMWDRVSKEKALMELVEKYDIDLSASYAYGDTGGDLTMFKHVGYPYAINPTSELLKHIQNDASLNEKVNVIVERKDNIYHLNIKDHTWY